MVYNTLSSYHRDYHLELVSSIYGMPCSAWNDKTLSCVNYVLDILNRQLHASINDLDECVERRCVF